MPLCCETAWSWPAQQLTVCVSSSVGWHVHRTSGSAGNGLWPTGPASDSDAIRHSYKQAWLCSWVNSVLVPVWQGGDPWTKWQGAKVGCMWVVGAAWGFSSRCMCLQSWTQSLHRRGHFWNKATILNVLNAWSIKDISSVFVSLGLVLLLWGLTSLWLSLVISVYDTTQRKAGFS